MQLPNLYSNGLGRSFSLLPFSVCSRPAWEDFCKFLILFVIIQADQSGTIVEILAEDGKPVAMETVSCQLQ
jgi:hypothetical protein